MRKFANEIGGRVYYERHRIGESIPRQPISEPSIFSDKRIVLVDMSGTQLNDTQVPKLIELLRELPDVSFLDLRCTEISMEGLNLIIETNSVPGLMADEEMLIQIETRQKRAGLINS